MPSRVDRAATVTRTTLALALVPALATILSTSDVARVLEAGSGGGVTFPFPTGLPTLWTYVSVPTGQGGDPVTGPLGLATWLALFAVGLVVTSALEAGFLGSLQRRLDGGAVRFPASARRYWLRMVGVNLVRFGTVLAVLPLVAVFPPAAFVGILILGYLVYGLPFAVVVGDRGLGAAIQRTVFHARSDADYAGFGIAHLGVGAVASVGLTWLVRSWGLLGIVVGAVVIAVPAMFVAAYGLVLFRDLDVEGSTATAAVGEQ